MASFPIAFPSVPVSSERLSLDKRQQGAESTFSYAFQVIHGASRWTLEWTFPTMRIPRAETVAGWGLSLNGMVGSFRYYPDLTVRSTLTGKSVSGTPAYGGNRAFRLGGFTPSSLSTIRVGQWISIGDQLLRVVEASALADNAGQVTVSFEPELRKTYAAGTAVEFVKPSGLFRLAASTSPTYTLNPDRLADFGTIQAIEVVSY